MKDILDKVISGEYIAYSDADGIVKIKKAKDIKDISPLSKKDKNKEDDDNVDITDETDSAPIIENKINSLKRRNVNE